MGLNSELFNTNGWRVATSSNNRMAVRCTGIYEKQENGEYIEVVNWEKRYWHWGWPYIYDCPWAAYRGVSCHSPTEVRDEWRRVSSEHRVDRKWKDGDIIIYNPDWTVKEWIKGTAHNNNQHGEQSS